MTVNNSTRPGDQRLIEEWLPIAALSEECIRERKSMTALPPTYYLHVWWARRPLVASRAAVLGALLPSDADRKKFLHVLGIHGDPVAAKERIRLAAEDIDQATGRRRNLGANPYGYDRAFKYAPSNDELQWVADAAGGSCVLDPMAGGGSIPFEAARVGFQTDANELNPVAWLILRATAEFPKRFGAALLARYEELGKRFLELAEPCFAGLFPLEPKEAKVDGYLWARTVVCPYCGGVVPLSPNWRLNNKGTGVRLAPVTDDPDNRHIRFEIVEKTEEQSPGTVSGGSGLCPFPDCGRVIEGDEIKAQAQAGTMGEQLYTIVYKEEKITGYTKKGKPKIKKVRGFRAPRPEDDVREQVAEALDAKLPEWQARNIIPDEEVPEGNKTSEPRRYGMMFWRDMFSPRQLYGHCTSVEVFHELVDECGGPANLSELDKAALTYLALAMDKLLNYNSRMSVWMPTREVVANTFNRHDFAFCWSHCEMAPTITGLGYDWAVKQTGKALKELIEFCGRATDNGELFSSMTARDGDATVTVTCESGDALLHVEDESIDAVVIDPPYYDKVMYAELSDFFYVWLKRTAGLFYPEQFSSYLVDKDREAVANPAKFKNFTQVKGSGGAAKRAKRDYQERMQAIFAECRRVLKPEGIMVVMFTHKDTGAWDAIARGLVEAGFVITASWPVNTEAEGSLHIKDKNAARSTILLVCRPREASMDEDQITYWEDVEPKVTEVVRERVVYFQKNGIRGVDLYLSCFGPALKVFSTHWPMQRGRAAQRPEPARGSQLKLMEDEDWDPYAVRPDDALNAARAAVKEWRLDQLTKVKRQVHLDPVTEFFALAWDAFQSPRFRGDEALKLARVVGVNFDQQLRGRILDVKGGDVILWDSALRAQKGALGTPKNDVMLNALHYAARLCREQNTGVAKDFLGDAGFLDDAAFMQSLETVLNVLPASALASSSNAPLAGAAADAGALEKLRRLCFTDDEVPPPEQLTISA